MLLTSFHVHDELLHILHVHIPNPVPELDHGELKSLLHRCLHNLLDVHILCKSIKKEIEFKYIINNKYKQNYLEVQIELSFSQLLQLTSPVVAPFLIIRFIVSSINGLKIVHQIVDIYNYETPSDKQTLPWGVQKKKG